LNKSFFIIHRKREELNEGYYCKKLFFDRVLHFEYDIRGQNLHFMGGFRMFNKFSHEFGVRRSMSFKRAIDTEILAHQ